MKVKKAVAAPVVVSVKNKIWTKEEIVKFVKLLKNKKKYDELVPIFGRTKGNLAQVARNLRLAGVDVPMGQRGAPKKILDIAAINAEINK